MTLAMVHFAANNSIYDCPRTPVRCHRLEPGKTGMSLRFTNELIHALA
jgi:hypothetical protein